MRAAPARKAWIGTTIRPASAMPATKASKSAPSNTSQVRWIDV
jgi:hypothetical protein